MSNFWNKFNELFEDFPKEFKRMQKSSCFNTKIVSCNCDKITKEDQEKAEYRELVKTYAGQILAANTVNFGRNGWKSRGEMIPEAINQAHALAKAVLESLENKEQKAEE